jgi:hypothetical protein
MKKLLITDFKKVSLYGDCSVESEFQMLFTLVGKCIKIKILGLFWVTYKSYVIK